MLAPYTKLFQAKQSTKYRAWVLHLLLLVLDSKGIEMNISTGATSKKPHPFRPFRFSPLKTFEHLQRKSSFPSITAEIQRVLGDEEWLLEPGQHATFPTTLIDQLPNQRIFTPSDFVSVIEQATNDDLHATAFDENGKRRTLESDQWNELKLTGTVKVPSKLFQNQHHKWRLAQGFYSGIQNIQASFRTGIGKVLDNWIVYTPRALFGTESVVDSLRVGIWSAVVTIVGALDQLWGIPLQHAKYSEATINTVLDCAEHAYVMYYLKQEKLDVPQIPSTLLDGTFDSKRIWEILEQDAPTSWNALFRPGKADLESQSSATKLLIKARLDFERVVSPEKFEEIHIRTELADASPKAARNERQIARLERAKQLDIAWDNELRNNSLLGNIGIVAANQAQADRISEELIQHDDNELQKLTQSYQRDLQTKHPILSTSTEWMATKVETFSANSKTTLATSRPFRLAGKLRESNLHSPAREQELRAEFQTKFRNTIDKQLQSHLWACPPAIFEVPLFHPGKWHSSRVVYHTSYNAWEFGPGYFWRLSVEWLTVVGHVKRSKEVPVEVGQRFWRLNYVHKLFLCRTKQFFGGSYHFLISGPLSLRALLSRNPFFAYKRVKPNVRESTWMVDRSQNGTTIELEDDPSSYTPTLSSRLASFYQALVQARQLFEDSPDTGLIGKNVQRFFLRLYLLFKSVLGTITILGVMVVGSLLATLINLVVVLSAPVLALSTVLLETLIVFLVYDFPQNAAATRSWANRHDGPSWLQHAEAQPDSVGPVAKIAVVVPCHLAFCGVVATFAAFRGIVIHPVWGAAKLLWTTTRQGLRVVRDFLTWKLIIRPAARVPGADNFLAQRIHGPGLASEYYYRLPIESALLSVQLALDSNCIKSYATIQEAEIMEPFKEYSTLFDNVLKPFGFSGICSETRPSKVSSQLIAKWQRQKPHLRAFFHAKATDSYGEEALVPTDSWDSLAQKIRSANPDNIALQSKVRRDIADQREASTYPTQMDQEIIDWCKDEEVANPSEAQEYKIMASRAGHLLAELFLRRDYRESRISEIIALPPQSRARYRMSNSELDQLWKFTLEKTKECLTELERDLSEYAKNSSFADALVPKTREMINRFYTMASGRPGKDTALVATDLLTRLFGIEAIYETLEDVDQSLLLMPKRSELDRHFDFGLFGNARAWNELLE